ncbi:WxcM-like domain-containing protein [Tahibacter amnicola]|uniref:WxcM-like domain-containing protein n=1 Tax=Tahibacter amnicola TaxID=2976241 RepID=A0ABY6BI25_9GAMM|nr:WxcM-like domain-containing protein [Tahibacter amnicola]UXI67512.1 WxcM-like domain-containing protein [Tahibacter amnicola]
MNYFVHPQGICESSHIGANTRIWAFAHVLAKARLGSDCNICDHVFIENDVVIGDRVTVKCGVQLWDGVTLEDDVFIGPNVTFTNDPFPRSKQYPEQFPQTRVCAGASIGANATILPGLTIGARAMVGAGAVVLRSVPPDAIVVGNPARIVGYVDNSAGGRLVADRPRDSNERPGVEETSVRGVALHRLPLIQDMRGDLSVGEFERSVPFLPRRYFLVFGVPSAEVRGEHAHRTCHQFLVCVKGSVSVIADDGTRRAELLLDRPNLGLHLPPMTWGIQYRYSADAVLLVFASEYYDTQEYIRDYDEFLRLSRAR